MFDDLPIVGAHTIRGPIQKGPSRLQEKTLTRADDAAKLKKWRGAVYARDEYHCRCCARRVTRSLDRIPQRAEAHHLHGRLGAVRYDVRTGICLCLACHEGITGAVNQRIQVEGTRFFTLGAWEYIDATARDSVIFHREPV